MTPRQDTLLPNISNNQIVSSMLKSWNLFVKDIGPGAKVASVIFARSNFRNQRKIL